jgi:hypothetical protein
VCSLFFLSLLFDGHFLLLLLHVFHVCVCVCVLVGEVATCGQSNFTLPSFHLPPFPSSLLSFLFLYRDGAAAAANGCAPVQQRCFLCIDCKRSASVMSVIIIIIVFFSFVGEGTLFHPSLSLSLSNFVHRLIGVTRL